MKTVIVTHEVKSYSDWRKVYDADEVNRSKAGLHISGVYRSVKNQNVITLIGEAPSEEAIAKFMADPKLKAAMEQGGVISVPEVKILNKV
jgi:quinol monooxygenase YgiN